MHSRLEPLLAKRVKDAAIVREQMAADRRRGRWKSGE